MKKNLILFKTGISSVNALFLSLLLFSCIPEAEEVVHTKRLIRMETETNEYRLTYNAQNRVEEVSIYNATGSITNRGRNTYDSKGYLVEKAHEDYFFAPEILYWKETFSYRKGDLVNGSYRWVESDSITGGYRNHEVVLGENGIEEYAHTTSLSDGVYFRIKRGLSAEGSVEWQEKTFETSPDVVSERQDISYDDQHNPFYGIGFYDPFDMRETNPRNIMERRVTGDSGNTHIHRRTYEYDGGYPTSCRIDTYDDNERLLFSSTLRYYYE